MDTVQGSHSCEDLNYSHAWQHKTTSQETRIGMESNVSYCSAYQDLLKSKSPGETNCSFLICHMYTEVHCTHSLIQGHKKTIT